MQRTIASSLGSAVIVFILVAVFLLEWPSSPDPQALHIHLATWTDENGPAGNRISFWEVTKSLSDEVTVSEGRVRLTNFLNRADAEGVCNYENLAPLRLNVVVGNVGYVAAVRQLDPDHLLMLFSTNVNDVTRPDWSADPRTIRLTRVPDESPLRDAAP